jgi:hypothetical protein
MKQDEKTEGTNGATPAEPAVRVVPEPERGPVTADVVKTLREDPGLADVAELAEHYV